MALLDYGQVKEMPKDLRLAYANLVVAMADDDLLRAEEGFRYAQLQTMLFSTVYIYLNSWSHCKVVKWNILCTVTKQSELELMNIWNMDSCLKWKDIFKDKMGAEY